jgi:carbonic anhydrase
MTVTDELVANNDAYAAAFTKGDLPLPPARQAVLACMDARLDPARVLGLEEGDAHVIRNAGGVVSDDAIRQSIARIQASPFVPRKDRVRGFVYEVETGKLREVS